MRRVRVADVGGVDLDEGVDELLAEASAGPGSSNPGGNPVDTTWPSRKPIT